MLPAQIEPIYDGEHEEEIFVAKAMRRLPNC